MPSGMRCSALAGSATRSANAPSGTPANTRSPTATPRTAEPSSRTTPASSAPGVNGNGGFIWYLPCTSRMSKKLQPAASTSSTTSWSRGFGSGTSRATSSFGSCQRSTTIALMSDYPTLACGSLRAPPSR